MRWVQDPPINTYALILIFIWLQTGFAMVVLSAAIKGVSIEVIEAARLDGATERQLFFRVIVPIIKGSIITVATTIAIVVLKIFDIVYVMTGGRFDTDVVANRMFLRCSSSSTTAAPRRSHRSCSWPCCRSCSSTSATCAARGSAHDRPGSRAPSARRPSPRGDQRFVRSAPLRIAVVAICVLWSIPTLGLLVTSVREPAEITTSGWWTALLNPFQTTWTLENYQTVIDSEGFVTAFINSLIVTIPATVIPITIAAFAAYAFAWIRFPFRGLLFAVVVGLLVVPLQMSLIPVLRLYAELGLNGTFLGIWLAHTAFGLPLAIFLLYNFMSQLPRDLFESAAIDGASHFQVFMRIVLPLSVPALGAFAIFQFLWVWNDLLVALVFLGTGEQERVLPIGADRAHRQPRRPVAHPDRRRVRDDDRAADRLPGAPAVLRARDPGRLGQVLGS